MGINMSDSTNTRIIESLYEELINLGEIAGELDPESNRQIDKRRAQIKQELIDLGEKL
jgi:hypothetical protein